MCSEFCTTNLQMSLGNTIPVWAGDFLYWYSAGLVEPWLVRASVCPAFVPKSRLLLGDFELTFLEFLRLDTQFQNLLTSATELKET